jgi:hypothetical protein
VSAEQQAEDVARNRNRVSGEFGTKTQTAPETSLTLAADARFAELAQEFVDDQKLRNEFDKRQFHRAVEILNVRIHAEQFDGVPHTLLLNVDEEDGETFFKPGAILDADGNVLRHLDSRTVEAGDSLRGDIAPYTNFLAGLGTVNIILEHEAFEPRVGRYGDDMGNLLGIELRAPETP